MTLLQPDFLPNKTETFSSLRYLLQDVPIATGMVNGGDMLPTQRGAGANMSVDVAAGSAWVTGQATARQGVYHVVNDATFNVATFATADATNPRIDQVILVVDDSSVFGGADQARYVIVTGTASSGATLVNRTGAVADATLTSTYKNWVRICDVLIPAGSTSVTTANIKERRPKSRGKTNIATSETRTNTAYGTMPTPDQVNEIVLPPDGLIMFGYQGTWQETVAGAASAAIFLGANPVQLAGNGNVPADQFTATGNSGLHFQPIYSTYQGLISTYGGSLDYTSDVTTGQIIGSTSGGGYGVTYLFAAAGTYDISVQFKSTSGSVNVKNRKLWVWVMDLNRMNAL